MAREELLPVSQRTQKTIWGLFAGRCAMCRKALVREAGLGAPSLIGEIAHIVGAKISAARGQMKPLGGRDDPDNLILLCRDHHKIIDDNEVEYTSERLHEIRSSYLRWRNGQLARAQPWSVGISQYSYLNVPRLDELAAMLGYRIQHEPIQTGVHLSSLGYDLNYLIARFQSTLENLPLQAIPVADIQFAHEGYVGQIVSFERLQFRTRNLPPYRPPGGLTKFTGALNHDPHVYHAFARWRFVINVDPRWITTDTSYGLFRPSGGSSVLSGFARINSVDYEAETMTATGLAIGLPPGFMDVQQEEDSPISRHRPATMGHLEDDVTKSLGRTWSGLVDYCQGCGRVFAEGDYMVDGPLVRGGPWGNICQRCFSKGDQRLGVGYGQLYRKSGSTWHMVGGYPVADADDADM
jgi:hypothetical protein